MLVLQYPNDWVDTSLPEESFWEKVENTCRKVVDTELVILYDHDEQVLNELYRELDKNGI